MEGGDEKIAPPRNDSATELSSDRATQLETLYTMGNITGAHDVARQKAAGPARGNRFSKGLRNVSLWACASMHPPGTATDGHSHSEQLTYCCSARFAHFQSAKQCCLRSSPRTSVPLPSQGLFKDVHASITEDKRVGDIHLAAENFEPSTEQSFRYLQVFTAMVNSFAHVSLLYLF